MVIYAVRAKLGNLILGGVGQSFRIFWTTFTLSVSSIFLNNHWLFQYDTKNGKVVPTFFICDILPVCSAKHLSTTIPCRNTWLWRRCLSAKTSLYMWYQINERIHIYIYIHKRVSYARSNLHFLHVQPEQIMHATKHAIRKGLSWMDDSQ